MAEPWCNKQLIMTGALAYIGAVSISAVQKFYSTGPKDLKLHKTHPDVAPFRETLTLVKICFYNHFLTVLNGY
jgi:hypothetical protein